MSAESRLQTPEIHAFAIQLTRSKRPTDILIAENRLGKDFYGIGAAVSLPVYETGSSYFPPFIAPSVLRQEYIVPYLCHPYIYFIKHELLVRPTLSVDYSIIFDSNFAGYINRFIEGKSLGSQEGEIRHVIEDILQYDLHVNPSFYYLENIKWAYPIAQKIVKDGTESPHKFWESLDVSFRQNIVNLELFRNINIQHYRKTRELKFDIDLEEAVNKSIDFTYWFYSSAEGQDVIKDLLFLQKTILFQLLMILKIQFSSRRATKNKIREFLEFTQRELIFFDRETIIAHKYFKDRRTIPLLGKVNKGKPQRDLMEKIDNLAWDMTAPRFLERMFSVKLQGDFTISFFLTLDKTLRELIRCYPIKAIIIDDADGRLLSIPEMAVNTYFENEGCGDIGEIFFSEEKRNERLSRERPTIEILSDKIKDLYKELSAILGSD